LNFLAANLWIDLAEMKMSSETRRAISVISFYSALLFCLLGFASRIKMEFHGRVQISTDFFVAAAVFGAFGLVFLLMSLGKKA
jgi:hypothetical protein